MKIFLWCLLFLILYSPFIILGNSITLSSWKFPPAEVVSDTLIQAILSALVSTVLGGFLALGLIWVNQCKPKFTMLCRVLCVLPSGVPAIVLLGSFYSLAHNISMAPLGVVPIIIIHSLVYSGVLAVIFEKVLTQSLSKPSEMAALEGASAVQFILSSAPMFIRPFGLGLFLVFSYCVTSFSVPLIAGGTGFETIEVFIYNLIRMDADVSGAVSVALLQSFVVLVLGWAFMGSKSYTISNGSNPKVHLISHWIFLLLLFVILMISFSGLLSSIHIGWRHLMMSQELFNLVVSANWISLKMAGLAFFLIFIFLSALGLIVERRGLRLLFVGYFAPSSVICGLSVFMLKDLFFFTEVSLALAAFLILFIPSLYKLFLESQLSQLENQIQVAKTLGASWLQRYMQIIFPQIRVTIFLLASLGAFWVFGDFAISSFMFPANYTLALMIKSLLSSYRIELANFLLMVLLLEALTLFLLLSGVLYVFDKKLRD